MPAPVNRRRRSVRRRRRRRVRPPGTPMQRTARVRSGPGDAGGVPWPPCDIARGFVLAERHRCNYAPEVTYEVQTAVFEGPFDLLLHLILERPGRPVRGVASPTSSTPTWPTSTSSRAPRPRGRHRVPARRRHPGRAQGPAAAPRRRATSTSTTSCGLWEERDLLLSRLLECKTFKDVAAGARRARRRRRPLCAPRGRPRRALHEPAPRRAGRRRRPSAMRAAYLRAIAPKPVPRVTLDHVHRRSGSSCPDAITEVADELPAHGPDHLPHPVRRPGRARSRSWSASWPCSSCTSRARRRSTSRGDSFATIVVTWVGDGADLPIADLLAADAYDG